MERRVKRRMMLAGALSAMRTRPARAQPAFRLGLTPVFFDNDAAIIGGLRRGPGPLILQRDIWEIDDTRDRASEGGA